MHDVVSVACMLFWMAASPAGSTLCFSRTRPLVLGAHAALPGGVPQEGPPPLPRRPPPHPRKRGAPGPGLPWLVGQTGGRRGPQDHRGGAFSFRMYYEELIRSMNLHEFTWNGVNLHEFTLIRINLHEVTCIDMNLHECAWICMCSPEFTRIYLNLY
jgi:hypothetical protein